ncbi:MAG: hypothetical protein G01um101456_707 [Parcubacteria group bacterium Gr01-1014_56]|nr:MAG: hypothetical protein G01um101456_707 [Parcubacteria group bacterium Gr01-1014_56]
MGNLFEGSLGVWLKRGIVATVLLLTLFLGVQVVAGFKGLHYIGAGMSATNTITVSGHGEAFAVPDIATFTFSVTSQKLTVALAQDDVTKRINTITAYLKSAGIDEKDIQTSDYSVYPQYEYSQSVCPASPAGGAEMVVYCPPGKQTLKGYEVRQTTTVKVRDTAKAGDLLTNVGGKGATEVSGLNFTFDNPDMVQTQARDKAIANAKTKAEDLARALGVSIVRVVSYNESGNYPTPMYYAKDSAMGMGGVAETRVSPEISVGQNKVISDVNITYEIR